MNYYKFLPPERKSYFKDELLRFTQPSDLNDPFECLPKKVDKKKLRETLQKELKLIIGKELINKVIEEETPSFIKDAHKTTNKKFGIFSLSKKWKNGLMWGHYTSSHKGFVIGFNSKHSFFQEFDNKEQEEFKSVNKVLYSKKRAEIPVDSIYSLPKKDIYLRKSLDWKYEKEIRVISSLNLASETINTKPYDINLFKVPHEAITEIILGVKINETSRNDIKEFCKMRRIKLFQAEISNKNFNIKRKLLLT